MGDEADANGHSFTEYKANGDATSTADGTKTAKCASCEETDKAADTDSKKAHTYLAVPIENTITNNITPRREILSVGRDIRVTYELLHKN